VELKLEVNGRWHVARGDRALSLLDVLRQQLSVTSVKRGCDEGRCGTCTVLLDGEAVCACLVLATRADGRSVTTVEALGGPDGALHPLQEAFLEHGAVQCGYCTPGMLVSAVALLRERATPTADEVREALSGNLCRCTGYDAIVEAVLAAAGARRRDVLEVPRAGREGPGSRLRRGRRR
jgi:carbon-monoxide dehydrogenase small subunit